MAARYPALLLAFADLLDAPGLVRFALTAEDHLPTWRKVPVRIGFHPETPYGPGGATLKTRGGWDFHKCFVTGRFFAMPPGASVPCLFYDHLVTAPDGSDRDPERGRVTHPEDRNPASDPIHPALVVAGPEAIAAAMLHKAQSVVSDLVYELDAAISTASLAAGLDPGGLDPGGLAGVAETRAGLIRWEGREDGYAPIPSGWRDLGRDAAK